MPKIRLRSPRFDSQSAADADKNNQQIRLDVCAADDCDGHEPKDAKQEPIDVAPPCTVPLHIGEIFLCKRPPDINNEKDRNEKPTEQNTAIAGPDLFPCSLQCGHI